jgi:hypothetical protein
MISKGEIIKIIQEYKAKVNVVAFPMHLPIDFASNQKALDFLSELVKNTVDNEVQLNDYSQLQQYMQATAILNSVIELPLFGTDKDQLKVIGKWHGHKFQLPSEPKPIIIPVTDVFAIYKRWQETSRYLNIPNQFQYEAYQNVAPYLEAYKHASREEQAKMQERFRALNMIKDPKDLFEKAKIQANNGIVALVELIKREHAAKENLINHVYIDLQYDFSGNQAYMSLSYRLISEWLTSGIDNRYRVTIDTVKDILDKTDASVKQQKKQKQAEKQAADDAANKRATDELKDTKKQYAEAAANDPRRQERKSFQKDFNNWLYENMYKTESGERQADLFEGMFEQIKTLKTEPSTSEYKQTLFAGNQAYKYLEDVDDSYDKGINKLINGTYKL